MTGITIQSSLFRDYGTSPATVTDLASLIAQTTTAAANALTSSTTAASAAASAQASATAASSAITTAVASVNAAVTNAQTTISASASSATTAISASTAAAATSASNAATSATNAASSATAAASSATAASTSSSAAASSATMAATSASAASTSATNAATSATAASASASSANSAATSALASATAVTSTPALRNALINGSMEMWQRGTSLTVPNGLNYTADMVQSSYDVGTGGTVTVAKLGISIASLVTAGFASGLQYAVTGSPTGGTYRTLQFPVEGPRTLAGQTVRLTFWAKADASRTLTGSISVTPGTGGSPAGGYTTSTSNFSVTTTWTQFTATWTLNAASTITSGTNADGYLSPMIGLPVNTALTVQITGVQLEVDVGFVTPFDFRPPAIERTLAQRYCEIIAAPPLLRLSASAIYGGTQPALVSFSTTKRAAPTVTLYSAVGLGGTKGVLATNVGGSGGTSSSFNVSAYLSGVLLYNTAALTSVGDYTFVGSVLVEANL